MVHGFRLSGSKMFDYSDIHVYSLDINRLIFSSGNFLIPSPTLLRGEKPYIYSSITMDAESIPDQVRHAKVQHDKLQRTAY